MSIRTHKLWMTMKEYKKWSKIEKKIFLINNDKTINRTHIYFE